jgi:LAO/AO transport system kinase
MNAISPADRRALSQALSRVADAPVREVLQISRASATSCRVIGITGSPGVGKSTLIARLARNRLRHPGTLGIVAIDPTSPISGGAILGDRIRMQDLAGDPRVFIRSFASRASMDGLTDNLFDILGVFDRAGFSELIVETVGTGQVGYAIKYLVDTNVLILMPCSGDQIQAMKGGILETADICVVNKSDLPGARQVAAELRSVLDRGSRGEDWSAPVLAVSAQDASGIEELGAAVDRHQAWLDATGRRDLAVRERRAHHVSSLVARRVAEITAAMPPGILARPLPELYRIVTQELLDSLDAVSERETRMTTAGQ